MVVKIITPNAEVSLGNEVLMPANTEISIKTKGLITEMCWIHPKTKERIQVTEAISVNTIKDEITKIREQCARYRR